MRGWLLIPVVLFLFACKGKNKIPPSVLQPKKMQAVLWDVMRADQFLNNYVLIKDSNLNKVSESLKYYDQIFAIHEISQEQFQESFTFYKEHPDLMKVIMDSMSRAPVVPPTQVIDPAPAVVAPIAIPDGIQQPQDPSRRDTPTRKEKKKGLPVQ
jgi:hypothetical protein